MFNNYLPYGNAEVREMSMPIVYYCRFLEFSVPVTFLQLILCIAALIFGLNRRSMLFFASYCFLWMLLFHGAVFFIFLFYLNYEQLLKSVFDSLLQYVINEDKLFCVAMEPFLHCKLPNGTTPDAIAEICDTKRQHHVSYFLDAKKLGKTCAVSTKRKLCVHLRVHTVCNERRTHGC